MYENLTNNEQAIFYCIKTIASVWRKCYTDLSADICSYLFRDENSFPKAKLKESVSLGEQIMSKDNIFTSNGAIVFHILQIFFCNSRGKR